MAPAHSHATSSLSLASGSSSSNPSSANSSLQFNRHSSSSNHSSPSSSHHNPNLPPTTPNRSFHSRRLAPSPSYPSPRRAPHSHPPAPLTPSSLIHHFSLPQAAYLHTPAPPPPGLDPHTPLLLYKTSHNTKVRAVSLKTGLTGHSPTSGPTLVIPDTYTGWFSVVSGRSKGATCLSSMKEVADKEVSFFLTRHELPAYIRIDESNSSNGRYMRWSVPAGHVLKLVGVFEDAKGGGQGGEQFAQCLDHKGKAVFVPLSAKGKFYATAPPPPVKGRPPLERVFLMSQLLQYFELPLTVRLVCGYLKKVPSTFTGLLRLESAAPEHVLLACTMTPDATATFLEMDVHSNFLLSPVRDPMFPKTPLYLKTKSYCEDESEAWQRQIKITYHASEKRQDLPPTRMLNLTEKLSSASSGCPGGSSPAKGLRHTRGLRELKARDRSREARRDGSRLSRDEENRSRDKSRTRDKSRDGRVREKSKDSKLRFRLRDKSKDRLSIKNPITTTFDMIKEKTDFIRDGSITKDAKFEKVDGKKHETRKVCKQNTYIFENCKNTKYIDKKKELENAPPPIPEHSLSYRLEKSVESQEYCTVIDDVRSSTQRKVKEEKEEVEDCIYSEICDNIYSTTLVSSNSGQSSANSSYNRRNNRDNTLNMSMTSSQNWSFGTGTSSSDENHYSFTLLRQEIGESHFRFTESPAPHSKTPEPSAAEIKLKSRNFFSPSRHMYNQRTPTASKC